MPRLSCRDSPTDGRLNHSPRPSSEQDAHNYCTCLSPKNLHVGRGTHQATEGGHVCVFSLFRYYIGDSPSDQTTRRVLLHFALVHSLNHIVVTREGVSMNRGKEAAVKLAIPQTC